MPERRSQRGRDLSPARSVTKAASPRNFLASQNEVDLASAASKTLKRTNEARAQTTTVSAAAAVPLHLPGSREAAGRFGSTSLPPLSLHLSQLQGSTGSQPCVATHAYL